MATTEETTADQPAARDIAGGVRDLLRGTGSAEDNKWRRGLRQGRESNLLFAVALRAADRSPAARTPLERDLLDIVGAVMTADELAAAAREYAAAVADLGEVPLLPTAVTAMPPSQGFGYDDLVARLPAMRAENAGRANCAVVDVAEAAKGAPIDSPEFNAAVEDTGFGITMLSGPPPAPEADKDDYLYYGKFEFDRFTCRKEVGDGLSGRDEIYWTAAARSDLVTGRTYQSDEFGAVEEGDTRGFTGDDRVVFDGLADNFVAITVQVWEADHSNSAWYDALHYGLNAWLNKPVWQDIALSIADGPPGMDVVEAFGKLFVMLKEAFRNKDDLSCCRSFVFDRAALRAMERLGTVEWQFNGDGHHTLRVKYSSRPPASTAGVLEYLTARGRDNATLSAPVPLGWRSATPAALAVFQDELHCAYARPGDFALMWSRRDANGRWNRPQRIDDTFISLHGPALTVWQDKLWLAADVPHQNRIDLAHYTDNDGWTRHSHYNLGTPQSPSLSTDGASMYLVVVAHNHLQGNYFVHLGERRLPTVGWDTRIAGMLTTASHSPTVAVGDGRLLAVFMDPNEDIVIFKQDGDRHSLDSVEHAMEVRGAMDSPTLVADPDSTVAWLAARNTSKGNILFRLRHTSPNAGTNWMTVGQTDVGAISGRIALAFAPNTDTVHTMYRRP
ncbi:hypothetical protein [Streptodolium elevatio]|uniref:Uncharacterized protein n=1 Tax=Streptodolium elevatio TaxID=3157996 RepID=A0ABV3DPV9_9ACTN